MIAEDVILPVNKRSIKRQLSTIHDPAVEVIDLEQRHTPSPTTPTPYGQTTVIIPEPKAAPLKKFFPIYMIAISLIQANTRFFFILLVALIIMNEWIYFIIHPAWSFLLLWRRYVAPSLWI